MADIFSKWKFFWAPKSILKIVTVSRSRSNSGTAPSRPLQLNLSLEGLGEVNYQQLDEAAAESNAGKDVEISLGPCSDDFDAARRPDLFGGGRDWLRLDAVAAHDVDQTGRDVGWIDTATGGENRAED